MVEHIPDPDSGAEAESDAALMERLARGEKQAWGVLYQRHGDTVLRVISRAVHGSVPAADVEDLAQEVFIKAFRAASRYQESGKFRAWLLRIAVREAKDLRNKWGVRARLLKRYAAEKRALASKPLDPERAAALPSARVAAALSSLPAEQQDVLLLAVGEGMNGNEIAATLGISANAVRARLYRARTALRTAVEQPAEPVTRSESHE